MILHKLLLIANNTTIYYSIKDFKDRRKLIDTKPEVVYNAWNVMHLIFPIVSTTFASFRSMYKGIPQGFIVSTNWKLDAHHNYLYSKTL